MNATEVKSWTCPICGQAIDGALAVHERKCQFTTVVDVTAGVKYSTLAAIDRAVMDGEFASRDEFVQQALERLLNTRHRYRKQAPRRGKNQARATRDYHVEEAKINADRAAEQARSDATSPDGYFGPGDVFYDTLVAGNDEVVSP